MTCRLISFLGIADYRTLQYSYDGKTCYETPFVARAQTKLFDCSEVIILATKKASEKNGAKLANSFRDTNIKPEIREIPDGQNEGELRQQFRVLQNAISEQTDGGLVLDITHGFRAQPFFAATAISTLAATTDLPEDFKITYGAMEATDDNGITPVWDLSPFLLMQDLAHGLAILKLTGHGKPLLSALRREQTRLSERRLAGKRDDFSHTTHLVNAIEQFTADLSTLRFPNIVLGGEKSSAGKLLKNLEKFTEDCARDHPALEPLLNDLMQMAKPLPVSSLFDEEGKKSAIALASLYLGFGRPLEAVAVAREAYVSLFANSKTASDGGSDDFCMQDRRLAEQAAMKTENGRYIAERRNDLLHAGMRKSPLAASKLFEHAKTAIEKLEKTAPGKAEDPHGKDYFVTRHKGAIEWAARQGIKAEQVAHLDTEIIRKGDSVYGTLPVHLAAEVCERGGHYFHLSLDIPPKYRGRELSADDMDKFGAKLEGYEVRRG